MHELNKPTPENDNELFIETTKEKIVCYYFIGQRLVF